MAKIDNGASRGILPFRYEIAEKDLDIKPVRQPTSRPWCGPACVEMVLAHHGIRKSQRAIAASLPMNKHGIRLGDMGSYLLTQGFDVTVRFWVRGMQPCLMYTGDITRALALPLNSSASAGNKRMWPAFCRGMRDFHKAGGKVILAPVHAEDIERAIARSEPPIININPFLLHKDGQTDGGHYVVAIHTPGRHYQTSEPMIGYIDPSTGREECAYQSAFIHSCHLWFGGGLFTSKGPRGKPTGHC